MCRNACAYHLVISARTPGCVEHDSIGAERGGLGKEWDWLQARGSLISFAPCKSLSGHINATIGTTSFELQCQTSRMLTLIGSRPYRKRWSTWSHLHPRLRKAQWRQPKENSVAGKGHRQSKHADPPVQRTSDANSAGNHQSTHASVQPGPDLDPPPSKTVSLHRTLRPQLPRAFRTLYGTAIRPGRCRSVHAPLCGHQEV